jgi:hypothetical protein
VERDREGIGRAPRLIAPQQSELCMNIEGTRTALARKVRQLGHLDLPGAGQVTISNGHAFVGHLPNQDQLGTSVLDISDPRTPRVMATARTDDPESHSHKVRVSGSVMVVNHERNMSKLGRRAEQLPPAKRALREQLGREPAAKEIAAKLSVSENDLRQLEEFERCGYHNGGFKVYDVSVPTEPQLICYQKTGGIGVHRFDMDDRYAYISTEMEGYIGNILIIYDLQEPSNLVGAPAPVASCLALRQRDVGELLARGIPRDRRVGSYPAADGRQLQLSSPFSRADAHRHACAGQDRWAAHRARDRRGRSGPECRRRGGALRPRACLHSPV